MIMAKPDRPHATITKPFPKRFSSAQVAIHFALSILSRLHISRAIKPKMMSVVSAPDKKMMVADEVVVFGGLTVREIDIVSVMCR